LSSASVAVAIAPRFVVGAAADFAVVSDETSLIVAVLDPVGEVVVEPSGC
jgi:hypothetical protein